jgi:uncharacterized protein YcfJ
MERRDENMERAREIDERTSTDIGDTQIDGTSISGGETHATTGGAAAAGAVTGGVIGLTGGPVGAAIGAVGGAIVGAAAERMMHSDGDARRATTGDTSTVYRAETTDATVPSTDVRSSRTSADINARAEDMTSTDTTDGGAP